MVDIETEIYNKCTDAVLAVEPGCFTASQYSVTPAAFPAATIQEIQNVTDTELQDSGADEFASTVTYRVDTFSNLRKGAKAQAKKMAQAIDSVMLAMNFTRVYSNVDYDPANSLVCTVTYRYRAVVDKNYLISRIRR